MPSLSRSDVRSAAAIKSDDAAVRSAMAGVGITGAVPGHGCSADRQPGASGEPAADVLWPPGRARPRPEAAGTGGSGVWISDLEAGRQNVRARGPGGGGRCSDIDRRGVPGSRRYRLRAELPSYWCSWSSLILPSLETRPPPFLIADEPTMARLATGLAVQAAAKTTVLQNTARPTWYSPVPAGQLTLAEADDVLARRDRLTAAVHVVDPVSGTPGFLASTRLDDDRNSALTTRDGVGGAITPVALAGVAVAVLLVAAAASFWVDQRRPEIRLLGTRGVSPAALGGKACLEMALPALTGTAVGWAAAIGLIKVVGPDAAAGADRPLVSSACDHPRARSRHGCVGRGRGRSVEPGWSTLPAPPPQPQALGNPALGAGPRRPRHRRVPGSAPRRCRRDQPTGRHPGQPDAGGVSAAGDDRRTAVACARGRRQLSRLRRGLFGDSRVRVCWPSGGSRMRSATAAVLVATAVPIGILVYATSVTRSMNAAVGRGVGDLCRCRPR